VYKQQVSKEYRFPDEFIIVPVPWRFTASIISLFAITGVSVLWSVASAQDIDCTACHGDDRVSSAAHPGIGCQECHANVTGAHLRGEPFEISDDNSCGNCHSTQLRAVGRSIHDGQANCGDCHGDPHEISKLSDLASSMSPVNQINRCGGCHDGSAELVDGYISSVHGKALLISGLIDAPSCSDCHGSHRISELTSLRAPTAHGNLPQTCGECHALLLDDWTKRSAHGRAWQDGEPGPICSDCHSSHDIADPKTGEARLSSAENCGGCHDEFLTSFRDSFHGKANSLGFVAGATCSDCHTPHKNTSAEDPESSVHPDNLQATCGHCHENATASFVTFDPHNNPSDPDDSYPVYLVWLFMTALLLGVFAFFGVHDILWLQRSLAGVLRGEFKNEHDDDSQYVRRFSSVNIRMHIVVITTFLILAATGLPLKFHWAPWAQQLMDLLGGVDVARFLHRLAAVGTFGYAIFHLGHLFVRSLIRREHGLLWGTGSMVPQPKDFVDFYRNMRYFLYLGERPAADRWTYFEKFDYFAVFWGVLIIGLSGAMLWFPELFTAVLPGWTLNAAYVIHSDEALLATGFIFIFHFFHTHLRPESFPMDIVIFTGKMPLGHFRNSRPAEYQRLVESGTLDSYLVEAPTLAEVRKAYITGSIALIIGVALAVGIIWALLTH
jgi:cytochrome b subunit of formate dehydrogenase/nitrate/TMAO reductase-like tetraheme cytochrome c subunit